MKIGPKYKIARRLGAPIFEKTQTQKYTLSLARKEKAGTAFVSRSKSEFGKELTEKQKARFSYGIGEKQFKNYVLKSLHAASPSQALYALLETRLDNVLYRAGFSKTRAQARQTASHGHVLLNERRVTIPSITLKVGDAVSLRKSSTSSPLFGEVRERMKTATIPPWLKVDVENTKVTISGVPAYLPQENVFDLGTVIEFYSR